MDAITFVMTAEVRTALLPTRQVEAVFWLIAIPRRSNQVRAACVMEPSWRHLRQRCKRSLAALGGRSWIRAAGCGDGKSTAISAKTNRWGPENFRDDHVRLLSNTRMPTRAISIDLKPFS